jgi:formylglycine-generating enzyme required for sulfatase activity
VLERLAFRAHASQGGNQQGTADISANELTHELSKAAKLAGKRIDPFEISEFLCNRVGILYQRGGANEMDAVYTFPHRSFQEYLAASYFRRDINAVLDFYEIRASELGVVFDDKSESWQYIAAHLGKTDPDRWREVVVLLGGMKSLKDPDPVWDLLEELIEEEDYTPKQQAWGMRLAAEILAESLDRSNLKRKKLRTFDNIQQTLTHLLGTPELPARERAAIGNYLAEIGDPRPEVHDVDAMPFCFVPKGKFWMGRVEKDGDAQQGLNESPAGDYDLSYGYWISQHPVSVAQFRAFIEAEKIEYKHPYHLREPDNTAMVTITLPEAVQFCEWLTKRWQSEGIISDQWRVTLPNEPEWEKAARGGYQVLNMPVMHSAKGGAFEVMDVTGRLQDNENPLRVYACGDTMTDEQVNYGRYIDKVTAMGVYPAGVSPYGCYDISGNVWEWTRSERSDYPFPEVGTNAWTEQETKEVTNYIMRGGSFADRERDVRCALRIDDESGDRNQGVGFRVVLSPLL